MVLGTAPAALGIPSFEELGFIEHRPVVLHPATKSGAACPVQWGKTA
jgi:hypothetical protein